MSQIELTTSTGVRLVAEKDEVEPGRWVTVVTDTISGAVETELLTDDILAFLVFLLVGGDAGLVPRPVKEHINTIFESTLYVIVK